MRFWDASATVPLLVGEERTADVRRLLAGDPGMVVWWMTRSECIHALTRRGREGTLRPLDLARARVRLHRLSESWSEMHPTPLTRTAAETFLETHTLRTADAYQLAAAYRWAGQSPQGEEFACLDGRLGDAARAEGFSVVP